MQRLAVLGSPIEHSLSPVLQATAYRELGLDFEYGRAEVGSGQLGAFLAGLDDSWLGLSLTMPLKREVMPRLTTASPLAAQLGVANTLVITRSSGETRLAGHNTDVDGITRAIRQATSASFGSCTILGGGATAVSALAAAADLGARQVTLHLRDESKADEPRRLAAALDVRLEVAPLSSVSSDQPRDFVISTLPGGVALPDLTPASSDSVLLDVAYDPWPSAAATTWQSAGAVAVSGLDMLVEQAIGQIRLFTGRAQTTPLPREDGIRDAMRASVGLPLSSGL